jgi:hypothetical protein
MLPSGHIAAGILLGARRRRPGGRHPDVVVAGAIVAACLPDGDLFIPTALDRLGIRHKLNSGQHHSWVTHTPLFWGSVACGAHRLAARAVAPDWAPEAARLLTYGVALHLVQDSVANTVALLWPLRTREYGLGLDGLGGETDHLVYLRRYPRSPAGALEGALVLAAGVVVWRRLARSPQPA